MAAFFLLFLLCPIISVFATPWPFDSTFTRAPSEKHRLSKKDTIVVDEDHTCDTYYGRPSFDDCEGVTTQIKNVVNPNGDSYQESYYEFIAIGHQSQFQESGEYHTPLFWSQASCIGALFVDTSPGHATSDVERWINIVEWAQSINSYCPWARGMGGRVINLGDETQDLIFYLYAPGSDFDNLITQKLTTSDGKTCSAAQGASVLGCSNNPEAEEKALPAPDPQVPSTIPVSSPDLSSETPQTICSVSCKSNSDCECGSYRCLQDMAVIGRLRGSTMGCVFLPLGGTSSFLGNKRDESSSSYDLSGCVCNVTYVGRECCDAPDGIVHLE